MQRSKKGKTMLEVKRIPPKKTVTVIEPKKNFVVNKEQHRQKKVAAYCRVSTDSKEQLNSYETQKSAYLDMISKNPEWTLAGIYADEGISGTRADKRPDFQRMIDDCLSGKIDYIICKSVSRFARNTVDCLEYVQMLKGRGIGVIFEEQSIDTLETKSELYLTIYAGFAQSESESISQNITWSVRNNFADGKVIYIYSRLLGYKKGENGEPEIVPEEAAVVRKIYEMYLAGNTPQMISDYLISKNITFEKKNVSFTKNMIVNVLTNVKYCGDAILQQTYTLNCITKTRKKNTGEDVPMYYVHNAHAPIVSREVFNKVQEEIARRRTRSPHSKKTSITATGKYSKYALTDVLICGECGTRYRRCTWSKYGKKKIVWRCINRLDYGTKYCEHSPTVSEEALKRAIVRAIQKFNQEDEATYMTLMKATIGDAIGLNGGNDEIDLLERRVDALNKRMINLVNESVKEGVDVEDHEDEFKELSAEIEQLNKRIKAIRDSLCDEETARLRLALIQEKIDAREQNQGVYDDSIVRQMVECIKVYPDEHIEVIFGGGHTFEETLIEDAQIG